MEQKSIKPKPLTYLQKVGRRIEFVGIIALFVVVFTINITLFPLAWIILDNCTAPTDYVWELGNNKRYNFITT